MKLLDLLYETWHALTVNKGRSLLTVLGIVIGISAVISMTSLIDGMKNMLVGELGLEQSREVFLTIKAGRSITFDDLEQMENALPEYVFITGIIQGSATISSNQESGTASITGAKPEYFQATGIKLASGRFFTEDEERIGSRMVVLDQNGVKTLFGNYDTTVVGQTVRIGSDDYAIIGVVESSAFVSTSSTIVVYMPFTTTQMRITGNVGLKNIVGFIREGTSIDSLREKTRAFAGTYFHILNPETSVSVLSMQSIITQFQTIMMAFSAIMASVASISLFVGGIGIMNMMLTNVTERIREIGLRKALGARRRDITKQFLLESTMLCVVGGVLGIIFGLIGAEIMCWIVTMVRPDLSIAPVFSPVSILVAVGVCVAIGLVFGYYPARRAAKLDPVESLRYQ